MHSIKNTIVAVMLLGVSYGVYQVLTTPDTTDVDAEMMQMISVNDNPMDSLDGVQPPLSVETGNDDQAFGDSSSLTSAARIPDQLLNDMSRLPIAQEFQKDGTKTTTEFSSRALPPAGSTTANSFPDGSTVPPPMDVPHRDMVVERDKALIDDLKDEINNSGQFESDSLVASPKNNLASVNPRPTENEAAKMIFDKNAAPLSPSTATLEAAWPKIESMVEAGQYRQALLELTQYYRSTTTPADQRQKLLNWLDLLAAKVIYSTEHQLHQTPYIIQPGDKIADLARQWLVPAQLIYNINRRKIPNPDELVPGTELKIIQGPFDAEIDTEQGEMTLYLDQMYAGRFAVRSGSSVVAGELKIVDKSARGNEQMPFWIGLSGGVNMFATGDQDLGGSDIGLAQEEASDVFSILSASSKVRVMR